MTKSIFGEVKHLHKDTTDALERLRVKAMQFGKQWKGKPVHITIREGSYPVEIVGRVEGVERENSGYNWFLLVITDVVKNETRKIPISFIQDIRPFNVG